VAKLRTRGKRDVQDPEQQVTAEKDVGCMKVVGDGMSGRLGT